VDLTPSNVVAWALAILLHAVVIGAFVIDWQPASETVVTEVQPYYIEASLASENPYTAKQKRDDAAAERARRIKAKKAADKKAAINREQILNEARLKALAEAKAKEDEADRTARETAQQAIVDVIDAPDDAAREERQSELQLAIEMEANRRKAVTDDEKAMAYVSQIQADIIQNWSRPPSARNGMEALLKVFLVPTGEVVDVTLLTSSGNDSFDRSALLAVRKAERFQVPDAPKQFERNFREFEVLFRPEDLRL
jgi:colicin import membrane protein